jgi:cell division protein FtsN
VAGAFRIISNAENLVSALKQKGYDSRILPLNEKGLTPVAFDGFSDRNDAVTSLREIQAKENKNAWIFDINTQK